MLDGRPASTAVSESGLDKLGAKEVNAAVACELGRKDGESGNDVVEEDNTVGVVDKGPETIEPVTLTICRRLVTVLVMMLELKVIDELLLFVDRPAPGILEPKVSEDRTVFVACGWIIMDEVERVDVLKFGTESPS